MSYAYGEQTPTLGETAVSWQTWSDGNGNIPTIDGNADWGKLNLDLAGEEGRSAVYDLGSSHARTFTLTENRYGTGGESATLQIRGDTTIFTQDVYSPNWETYSGSVSKTWQYVQIREVTGTIYYIDATGGDDGDTGLSEALAWQTISKINGSTFNPGDRILFKCGETWAEQLTIPSAGIRLHPITLGSYGTGAKPIITGSSTRDYCILETNAYGYIVIDGLQVQDAVVAGIAHNQYTGGSVEVATPGWIVQNCTFLNCIAVLFGPDSIFQDNVMTGFQDTEQAAAGAVMVRGAVASNCIVRRNTISNYYGRGIWFVTGVNNPTAINNIIHDIGFTYGTSSEGYGINFDGYGQIIRGAITCTGNTIYNTAMVGVFLENCSDASKVHGNLIHDTVTYGIWHKNYAARGEFYGEQRGNVVDAVDDYNIIYNVNKGIVCEYVKGVDIWNNVIDNGTGTTPIGIGIPGAGSSMAGNFDIRNNIFGADFSYCYRTVDAWENLTDAFDYNRVKTSTVIFEITGSVTHTLAGLQGESKALNCFTTDPAWVNEAGNNYHLADGSPCIGEGVDVGLTLDFDNISVDSPPDIGAFEHV